MGVWAIICWQNRTPFTPAIFLSDNNEGKGRTGSPGVPHFGKFGVKSILFNRYEVKAIISVVWPPSPPDYGMVLSLTFAECLGEMLSLLL